MSAALPDEDLRRWLRRATDPDSEPAATLGGHVAVRTARRLRFSPRAVLLQQDEVANRVLLIESGEVELVRMVGPDRLIVQLLGPGATVGDMSLLLALPAPFTAYARTPVVARALELDALASLLRANPEVAFAWLEAVARKLERSYRRVLEMSGKSGLERVAQLLYHEVELQGADRVVLTQTQIAELLVLSRQTVSRALGELQAQDLVVRRRGYVQVLNATGLRRLAHSSRAVDGH
jgi:CRP-like cAMP-binding protein